MPTTITATLAYIEQLPPERQAPIAAIRNMIRAQWPKVKEDMSNGMPTYHLDGRPVFALASQKNHITFYVMPYHLLSAFKHDLRTRNCGRTCIRFRRIEDGDMELLERMVKYVGATFSGSDPQPKVFARA